MAELASAKAGNASPSGTEPPPAAAPGRTGTATHGSGAGKSATTTTANTKANLDSLLARLSSIDSELDDLRLPRFAMQRMQRGKPSTASPESPEKEAAAREGPTADAFNTPKPDVEAADPAAGVAEGKTDEAEAIFNSVMQRLAQLESKSDDGPVSPSAPEGGKKRQKGDECVPIEASVDMAETLRSFRGDGHSKPAATDALLESLLVQLNDVKPVGEVMEDDAAVTAAAEPLSRSNSKKQRLRSSSTSPARPARSACSTDVSSYSTSARDGIHHQAQEPPALLGQHQQTLHGLIGHLQQLTQALQQATGATLPPHPAPPTTAFLAQGRADMQEVVHSALTDLSTDLNGQPPASPDRLSVDELMSRADKLCNAMHPSASESPMLPLHPTQDMSTLLDDDFLTADCEFGLDAWAHDICLPNEDLASLHLSSLPCEPDI